MILPVYRQDFLLTLYLFEMSIVRINFGGNCTLGYQTEIK